MNLLTYITIVSHKLIATIPRGDFNKFTYMTRYGALEEGNIVEKDFMTFNFYIIWLMNYGTYMNISTDDSSSMIRCLTSIDLIMNVRSIEMWGEGGKIECSITMDLSVMSEREKAKVWLNLGRLLVDLCLEGKKFRISSLIFISFARIFICTFTIHKYFLMNFLILLTLHVSS